MTFRLSEDEFRQLTKKEPAGTSRPKRLKYRNKKERVDGERFDSRLEARHWAELKLREAAGEIRNLKRQVRFPMVVNGFLICTFIVDFVYEERLPPNTWRRVASDTKNPATRKEPYYRLKYKLMQALHGLTVREVLAKGKR